MESIIKNEIRLIMVYIYANWCGPCITFEPELLKLAKDYYNEVLFLKINSDESSWIEKKFE